MTWGSRHFNDGHPPLWRIILAFAMLFIVVVGGLFGGVYALDGATGVVAVAIGAGIVILALSVRLLSDICIAVFGVRIPEVE